MARILVVDDERDLATMLKLMLDKDKHTVQAVFSGEEALAATGVAPADASKPAPELIIMDLMMPAMDGYETAERLHADPRLKAVPVMLLTGRGSVREDGRRAANIVAQLDKPFDPKALRARVAELLAGAR